MDLLVAIWAPAVALALLGPLGAILGRTHASLFGPPVEAPVRCDLTPASVRYELGGTALWVALGVAVWIAVVAVVLGLAAASESVWGIPLLAFGALYSFGAIESVGTARPAVRLTIGLHRLVVRRTWLPGLAQHDEIGAERVLRAKAVAAGPGTRVLVVTTRDGRTIRGPQGPEAFVEHLAAEVTQMADRPRTVGIEPRSLDALLERARQ